MSDQLVSMAKKTYTEEVQNLVLDMDAEHQSHVQTVLARQRRDYGKQAFKIDETPMHNIGMETQCGMVDYRLKKL